MLQQTVRREKSKVENFNDIIENLRSKQLLRSNSCVCEYLKNSFSGLSLDIIKKHFLNQHKDNRGNR